jgi:hypothetical protein
MLQGEGLVALPLKLCHLIFDLLKLLLLEFEFLILALQL